MRRIGLTLRVECERARNERRDELDQRWPSLVEQLGACPVLLPNQILDVNGYLNELKLDALVLTGGNDISILPHANGVAPERDKFEYEAYQYFLKENKPILGVCRGAQLINYFAGGRLERMSGHAGVRHSIFWKSGLPEYLEQLCDVNSYHGWVIPKNGLAPGLEALAWASDGSIEAFRVMSAKVFAILWHPERKDKIECGVIKFMKNMLHLQY